MSMCLIFAFVALARDDPKDKDKKKPLPVVALVLPPFVARGGTTKVEVRGLNLDQTSELRLSMPIGKVEIKEKGKADVPQGLDAKKVGNTRVTAKITLPESIPEGPLTLTAVTEAGESAPRELMVERILIPQTEREPNNSLRLGRDQTAPPSNLVIDGRIDKNQDVDVFFFSARAGDRLTIEAIAARFGSPLDPLLWVHDSSGRLLADRDDEPDSADPRLDFKSPADGVYSVSLLDALDRGGPLFVYRLRIVSQNAN